MYLIKTMNIKLRISQLLFVLFICFIVPSTSTASITYFDNLSNSYAFWTETYNSHPVTYHQIEITDTNASSSITSYHWDSDCTDPISYDQQIEQIVYLDDLYFVRVARVWQSQEQAAPLCVQLELFDSSGSPTDTYTYNNFDDPDYLPLFTLSSTTITTNVETILSVVDTSSETQTYAIYTALILAFFITGFIITAWISSLYMA